MRGRRSTLSASVNDYLAVGDDVSLAFDWNEPMQFNGNCNYQALPQWNQPTFRPESFVQNNNRGQDVRVALPTTNSISDAADGASSPEAPQPVPIRWTRAIPSMNAVAIAVQLLFVITMIGTFVAFFAFGGPNHVSDRLTNVRSSLNDDNFNFASKSENPSEKLLLKKPTTVLPSEESSSEKPSEPSEPSEPSVKNTPIPATTKHSEEGMPLSNALPQIVSKMQASMHSHPIALSHLDASEIARSSIADDLDYVSLERPVHDFVAETIDDGRRTIIAYHCCYENDDLLTCGAVAGRVLTVVGYETECLLVKDPQRKWTLLIRIGKKLANDDAGRYRLVITAIESARFEDSDDDRASSSLP